MEWSDERWVKLYIRNTGTWVAIGWEGRFVLMSLLRQVDRAGVLSVSTGEEAETVAAMIMAPVEVVRAGLDRLIARKVVVMGDDQLRLPSFLAAQNASASDKIRQQRSRENRALGTLVSQNVTECHEMSRAVTNVTTRLEETRLDETRADERERGPTPSDLQGLWNSKTTGLPKCRELTEARKAKARARLADRNLDEWAAIIDKINATPFLLGDNDRGWRVDFDFLLKPDSAAKILEGKYESKKPVSLKAPVRAESMSKAEMAVVGDVSEAF